MAIRENQHMVNAGYVAATRLAGILGVSLQTVHSMHQLHGVEAIKQGRVTYLKLASVEAYYKDNPVMLNALAPLKRRRAS
jgi:hypothetical protein